MEYADVSCNHCGKVFGTGDRIYPLTLWIFRWNVCIECREPVKKKLEALFFKDEKTQYLS